jgi:hypothetical protein
MRREIGAVHSAGARRELWYRAGLAPVYQADPGRRLQAAISASLCKGPLLFSRSGSDVIAAWGPVAQRLELAAHNRLVPGSSPGGPTNKFNQLDSDDDQCAVIPC